MKRSHGHLAVLVAYLTILVACLPWAMARAAGAFTITVHASTFRTPKGSLRCRLYSSGDGFPGKPPFDAQQAVAVSGKTATCTFAGVGPGKYAVALFHDENDDGKLETNFLGIPREGVGVSNNRLRSFGPPTWDDASFMLRGDLQLDVKLHY
jgi:uncharacterized protein (DUF2141 family)